MIELAKGDIAALATLPGDKRYFFGATALATHAAVHSFVVGGPTSFCNGPHRDAVREHYNLIADEAWFSSE